MYNKFIIEAIFAIISSVVLVGSATGLFVGFALLTIHFGLSPIETFAAMIPLLGIISVTFGILIYFYLKEK